MPLQANQLGVKQSPDVAGIVAAAIFDATKTMPSSTGVEKAAVRQLTKHAKEVLALHDLAADTVQPDPAVAAVPDNGYHPTPVYTES